jgi:His/Glu/Gln/Arg/opine family amino acid ABC transporter permease subunit
MDYLLRIIGPLLEGTGVTLQVFLISFILSVPLGLALALVRVSRFVFVSGLVNGYIWLMRGTPLMLQMLFIYCPARFHDHALRRRGRLLPADDAGPDARLPVPGK